MNMQALSVALAKAKLPVKVIDGVEHFRFGDMVDLLHGIKSDDVKKSPIKIQTAT
jgi:hypothetical protein